MLTIDLPEEIYNRLDLLSLSTGRSMQFYVTEAVLEQLDYVEDKCHPMLQQSDDSDDGTNSGFGGLPSRF